ncbi:UDP-glucose 4-epimerase [Trichoderma simmonsii]|uniref:UDP-glucose 4-epimerase n=2 Tax=Trichoderma TaxID=5543 RepID=A0A8G0LLN8_9HYPO|nr:UDP-glucose 4-epimerase [Trichoderma simmonsii]
MASRPLPRLLASSPSPSLSSYTRTASHAQPPSLYLSLAISAVGFQDRHRSQSQRRIQRHYPSYSQVDPRLSRQLIRGVSAPIAQTLLVARSNKIRSPLLLSPSHSHRPGLFFSTATPHLQSRRSTTMAVGTVLITGGTGYIGSFTTLALLDAGYDVVIVDSLYNSSKVAIDRIELLAGRRPDFYQVDITDEKALDEVFAKHPAIDSVIHFAALKAVGESSIIPLEYYRVNVGGSIALLQSMTRHNVTNIVFSSSATVYGDATRFPDMIPIPEHCPIGPTNTYGRTKSMIEDVITDYVNAQRTNLEKEGKPFQQWNGALLRYFNPCGAHPSGIMGEDPQGVPFNLLPLLGQVATGQREKLLVFGEDYPSRDGTAIRDYIHVVDLARGHLEALNYLRSKQPGVKAWNLGSGRGSTVFEIIKAFSNVVGRDLKYEVVARRPGDVLDLTANPKLANEELQWKTELTMEKACEDLWRWVSNNPQGYRQEPPAELLAAIKKA